MSNWFIGHFWSGNKFILGLNAQPEIWILNFTLLQFHELISKISNSAANAQALNINVSHHVLARSKAEILHLVELLIESNRGELVDLLVDVVDIILHCIDHNHLKSRSLSEVCMYVLI
mgnify:CR=1 FL=1